MTPVSLHTRRMVISALFLGIALVLRAWFSFEIPLLGAGGIRIGAHGIFAAMPAILFGPFYGAAVWGLTDLLGYFLRPGPGYIPLLTVTAAAGGYVRGVLWMFLRGKGTKAMRISVIVFAVVMLGVGVGNALLLRADGVGPAFYDAFTLEMGVNAQGQTTRTIDAEAIDTEGMHAISRMLVIRTLNVRDPGEMLAMLYRFVTWGAVMGALLGFLLLVIEWAMARFTKADGKRLLPLLLTMMLGGLFVTTLNTEVLRLTLPAWRLLPFMVLWVPRAIEEIAGNTLKVYFMALLLGVFAKHPALRMLLAGEKEKTP